MYKYNFNTHCHNVIILYTFVEYLYTWDNIPFINIHVCQHITTYYVFYFVVFVDDIQIKCPT